MNFLFICKHNRFRSKTAEAIFNKLNKNSENLAKSAGIQMDFSRPYIAENVKKALKDREIESIDEKAREISIADIKWADKIIVAADNVPKEIFPREKTEFWNIPDADEKDAEKIEKITEEIERKVRFLTDRI